MSYLTDFQNFARQTGFNSRYGEGYQGALPTTELQKGDPNYWGSMADFLRGTANAKDAYVNAAFRNPVGSEYYFKGNNRTLDNTLKNFTPTQNQDVGGAWSGLLNNPAVKLGLSRGDGIADPYLNQLFGTGWNSVLNQRGIQNQLNWDSIINSSDPRAALFSATNAAATKNDSTSDFGLGQTGLANWLSPLNQAGTLFNADNIRNRQARVEALGGDIYADSDLSNYVQKYGKTQAAVDAYINDMQAYRPVDGSGNQMQGNFGDGSQYLWSTPEQGQQWQDQFAVGGYGGAPLQGVNANTDIKMPTGSSVYKTSDGNFVIRGQDGPLGTINANTLSNYNYTNADGSAIDFNSLQADPYGYTAAQDMPTGWEKRAQRQQANPYMSQQQSGYAPIQGAPTQQFNYYSQGTPINNQPFSNFNQQGGNRQYMGLLGNKNSHGLI